MAKSKISDLGYKICVSDMEEERVPALGNGDSLPGELVTILAASGKVDNHAAGAVEGFVGILDKVHDLDIDTAPADGQACSVIVPKSGHRYRIRCTDPAGDKAVGEYWEFSDTEGELKIAADAADKEVARNSLPIANGDTVGEFWWA